MVGTAGTVADLAAAMGTSEQRRSKGGREGRCWQHPPAAATQPMRVVEGSDWGCIVVRA